MDEASARAKLAGSPADLGAQAVATTLPRAAIEDALRSEGEPPELILELVRLSDWEGERRSETRSVSVDWEPADLERLLELSEGDPLTLAFDAESLERAFWDNDVEAHGFREKVVILAAVAAAATAGPATAAPDEFFSSAGAGASTEVAQTVRPDDRAVPRPMPVSDVAPADAPVRPDDRAAPRPMPVSDVAPADAPVRPDDRAVPRPMPVSDVAPADAPVRPDDRAVPRPMPAPVSVGEPGDGFVLSAPSPGDAAIIAGGIALAIAGAAFAARTRRPQFP